MLVVVAAAVGPPGSGISERVSQSTAANQLLLNSHLIGFRIRVQFKLSQNKCLYGDDQARWAGAAVTLILLHCAHIYWVVRCMPRLLLVAEQSVAEYKYEPRWRIENFTHFCIMAYMAHIRYVFWWKKWCSCHSATPTYCHSLHRWIETEYAN